jgi:hypothetical protein
LLLPGRAGPLNCIGASIGRAALLRAREYLTARNLAGGRGEGMGREQQATGAPRDPRHIPSCCGGPHPISGGAGAAPHILFRRITRRPRRRGQPLTTFTSLGFPSTHGCCSWSPHTRHSRHLTLSGAPTAISARQTEATSPQEGQRRSAEGKWDSRTHPDQMGLSDAPRPFPSPAGSNLPRGLPSGAPKGGSTENRRIYPWTDSTGSGTTMRGR